MTKARISGRWGREPFTGSPLQIARDVAVLLISIPLWMLALGLVVATSIIWVPLVILSYAAKQRRIHNQMHADIDAELTRVYPKESGQ